MLSINDNDCLACAIATAKGVSYKVIFYSVRTLGKYVNSDMKEYMGMKSIPKILAVFTRKRLVLTYTTNAAKAEGHAVAIINGKCVDNCANSTNENRSVLWLLLRRDVIRIFIARK
jgi:hypothetical protein